MRDKPISRCAPAPLGSLILSHTNFAALIFKKTCLILLEEAMVMNMMFPECRSTMPYHPTTILCTPPHPHSYPRTAWTRGNRAKSELHLPVFLQQ